jgi:predicted transcriptional regulator YdeE
MAELIRFEVIDLPETYVVGKLLRADMEMQKVENPIPAFWGDCFSKNSFKTLEDLNAYVSDPSYVGLMCDWMSGDGCFSYICGMMMKPGCPVPEGYAAKTLPTSKVAVGWIRAEQESELYQVAHQYTQEALEKAGYTAEGLEWCMEVYNCPRFTTRDDQGRITLDYYIPCRVK